CSCSPDKFRVYRGRWDRNRTCNLRFWSLLPFVQLRSGTFTSPLKMAHFEGPKYQEVHQCSPASGVKIGVKCRQPSMPYLCRPMRGIASSDLALSWYMDAAEDHVTISCTKTNDVGRAIDPGLRNLHEHVGYSQQWCMRPYEITHPASYTSRCIVERRCV